MKRSFRQTQQRYDQMAEDARQRSITLERARKPAVSLEQTGFAAFATDLTREHALALSKPSPQFVPPPLPDDPNRRAAVADEVFTEGRVHRKAPAPVNYHENL